MHLVAVSAKRVYRFKTFTEVVSAGVCYSPMGSLYPSYDLTEKTFPVCREGLFFAWTNRNYFFHLHIMQGSLS